MLQAAGYYYRLGSGALEVAKVTGSQLALGAMGRVETLAGDLAWGLSVSSVGQVAGVTVTRTVGMNIAVAMIVGGLAIAAVVITALLFKKGSVHL